MPEGKSQKAMFQKNRHRVIRMKFCPNCGSQVPDNSNFCLGCGTSLIQPIMPGYVKPKSDSLKAAGILTIIGAVFCLLAAIFSIFDLWDYHGYYEYSGWSGLISLIFNPLSFTLGLISGILILKRKSYVMAIIGTSFVIVGGGLAYLGYVSKPFGIIALLLGILALVFVIQGKKDFIPKFQHPQYIYQQPPPQQRPPEEQA